MIALFIYWIATTIYGVYWLIKHPSVRRYEDREYFTLLELIAKFFLSSILAWVFVPLYLLSFFRFKR